MLYRCRNNQRFATIISQGTKLGIADLFKKRVLDEVVGTRVLVAGLDGKFSDQALGDRNSYAKFYAHSTQSFFQSIEQLVSAIKQGYDVVHLLCDVSTEGLISSQIGDRISGTALIQTCFDSGTKLLWIASANDAAGYIKDFKPQKTRLNLVMTLNRKEPSFNPFLEMLFSKMSAGNTMPMAWVSIAPQHSKHAKQQGLPECIFAAGRGSVVLR